ncbi:MAG: hypothetical protein U5K84_01260 [Alkalibacterium sp.]|nr:hypothetical protein [Alkalibacterium sp.]
MSVLASSSSKPLLSRPIWWMLEALPEAFVMASDITFTASGCIGVVAA